MLFKDIFFHLLCIGAGANADAQTSRDHVTAVCIAKDCLLAGAKTDPRAAHIWANLANAYHLIGDHRNSGKCLEKVLLAHCPFLTKVT